MEELKYRVNDDALIRYTPITYSQHILYQGEVVITKKEFIACYNAWIKEADNETN